MRNPLTNTLPLETLLRPITGSLLWLISAILTASLFMGFAQGNIASQTILLLLAIGFEGSKILTWKMGGPARILSIVLIGLSLVASFGAALHTVNSARSSDFQNSSQAVAQSPLYLSDVQELKSIETEITQLLNRLSSLPQEYISAANNLTQEIQKLRDEKSTLSQELKKFDETTKPLNSSPASMFDDMASVLNVKTETLELVLLLIMAIALEISALVLASDRTVPAIVGQDVPRKPADREIANYSRSYTLSEHVPQKVGRENRIPKHPTQAHYPIQTVGPEEEVFLKTMIELGNQDFLAGRDTTARYLNFRPYQAKKIVRNLEATGKIAARGKRLVLVNGR